jgi:hypothetical protein
VPEQRVQDDKNDLEQRNGQRMIAAPSQRRAGVSRPPNSTQRFRARKVIAGRRWTADGLDGLGHARGELQHILVRAGDRIPRRSLLEEPASSGRTRQEPYAPSFCAPQLFLHRYAIVPLFETEIRGLPMLERLAESMFV